MSTGSGIVVESRGRKWYAVFTLPQNEKSVMKHLALRGVEGFLPTYETLRVWKNRQRVRIVLPLFPTYLFVRIGRGERIRVLESPGVVQIVGWGGNDVAIADEEIELLRVGVKNRSMEPYSDLAIGERVRIKSGSMEGVEGVLIRKGNSLRFVLTIALINQSASVQIAADDLERLS